jgi:hypothetical protein
LTRAHGGRCPDDHGCLTSRRHHVYWRFWGFEALEIELAIEDEVQRDRCSLARRELGKVRLRRALQIIKKLRVEKDGPVLSGELLNLRGFDRLELDAGAWRLIEDLAKQRRQLFHC